jgi:FeS assembly SUF system protein
MKAAFRSRHNIRKMEENEVKNNEEVLTAEDVKELTPLYENVILALKQVYDPEIPVNIYDLGLIYELNIRKSREVYIKMTFTAPNCPMADEVMAEVKRNVEDVPNVKGCSIDLVFEPVWDQSMMSDEAKVTLGFDVDFDDAPQSDDAPTA